MAARGGVSRLEGFKEAREALSELSLSVSRGIGKKGLNSAGAFLVDRLKERAPVSDDPHNKTRGSLRDGTSVKPARARKGAQRVAVVVEDPAAVPIEFGTSKMPAKPYARATVDANRVGAGEAMGTSLKSEVDRAAQRAARRGLKG